MARAALMLVPNGVRTRITLSDILSCQNKPLEALHEALQAALAHPDNALAYAHLGQLLQRNGEPGAEAALQRAARLDPDNAHFRHQLSHFLHRHGRLNEAIEAAREATALEPGNGHRFEHLARLLLADNDIAAAETAQRQAVRLNPRQPGVPGRAE